MKTEKVGKFIKELREKQNISQDSLAKKLYVDRSLISKWENGKLSPDIKHIQELCKIFNVKLEELLSGERLTNKNEKTLENNLIDYVEKENNKYKKVKKIMIILSISLLSIILFFLVYYFIQTYNKTSIYKVTFKNEKYSSYDGILILTRENSYLKLGKIEPNVKNIKLLYKDKIKEEIFYEGAPNNILSDSYGYNSNVNLKNFNTLKNNLYILINEDEIKINFAKQYSNISLIPKKYNSVNNTTSKNLTIPENIKKEFSCGKDTCYLDKDNISYMYDINTSYLYITNYKETVTYNILNKDFFYENDNNNFSIDKNEAINCYSKTCKNELKIYKDYYNNYIKKYL